MIARLFLTVRRADTVATIRIQGEKWILSATNTLRIRSGSEQEIWADLREFARTGQLPTTQREELAR